jgi:radical SAM protein with 4Fe4S-binding SPASM domain
VFVAMRRNVHELPALVRLVADCGVGRLWVQNLSHEFTDTGDDATYAAIRAFTASEALWHGGAPLAHRYFAEAADTARAVGVDLRLPVLDDRPRPRAPGTPGCDWPWRSAYVRHDGKVQPCCMLMGEERAILGDLAHAPFEAVWNGPAYADFRARLVSDDPPDVCRGCAMYRGVF